MLPNEARRELVYRACSDHSYRRLQRLGLDPIRAVLLMHLAGVVLGLIAFMALGATVTVANLVFAGVVLAGLGMVIFLGMRTDVWR